jgi:glycosyltransferase involved in cell wall biosynthesis
MGLLIPGGHIFAVLCWLLAAAWLGKGIAALRGMARLPDLGKIDSDQLPAIARNASVDLTVIVPARDEEAAIEASLCSLLASTEIRLQIIALDDRSTDRTGPRMDAIVDQAPKIGSSHSLEVIHITDLPAGWLGKPHAMSLAAQRATASWILFTDGDVLFAPHALSLALREAIALNADHVVLLPTAILHSVGERAILSAMQALSTWAVRLWKVGDPRARDCFGAGGFNLIRNNVYRQVGGFEALRMEVLEDIFLGMRVKRAGFAQRVILGSGLVNLRWIEGIFGVVRLLEKNGFAVSRFRASLHLLASFAFAVDIFLPLAAITRGGWTMAAGLLTYAGLGLVYQSGRRVTGVPAWHALLFAPAVLIIGYGFLRSMMLALLRGGVVWRGTLYPLSELRRAAGDS